MKKQVSEDANLKNTLKPWRYLFAGFALVLLVFSFYAEENWRGRRAWENYRQAAIARGEPVRIKDLVPPRVPDEQNFTMTPSLEEFTSKHGAQDFLREFGAASAALNTPKVVYSSSWIAAQTDLQAWAEAFRVARSNNVEKASAPATRTEAAAVVLSALSVYDPMVDESIAACKRPYSRFNLQYNDPNPAAILLPHLSRVKVLCQMLQLRASAELSAGKPEAALATIKLAFHVADSMRDEPTLIAHLVRIACVHIVLRPVVEGLASHQWSDPQLAELSSRLEQFDFCTSGHRALLGERAFGIEIIDYLRNAADRWAVLNGMNGGSSGARGSFDPGGMLLATVPKGWFYFEQVNAGKTIDSDLLPAFDLANRRFLPGQSTKAEERINSLVSGSRIGMILRHRYFIGLLLPAVGKAVHRSAFTQSALDSAVVGCGLERFRLANGRYPKSLGELQPKLIKKLPRDVLTGEPFKYSRISDGQYMIYSVGWNQTDEGGVIATNKSGQGVDLQQGDWVWRLPATE